MSGHRDAGAGPLAGADPRAAPTELAATAAGTELSARTLAAPIPLASPEALAVLLLALSLLAATGRGHVDDLDAQTYRVLVRHLAEDRAWLSPRFLPGYWPAFREHLPFGFWPATAAARALGLRAAEALHLCCSLGTIALLIRAGGRAFGGRAGLAAGLLLALTESFWRYGGRLLLEPLLRLLATAAALPLLVRPPSRRDWWLAVSLGALACAVKGPFGLAPLACAGAGRALATRSARTFALASLSTIAAALPVVAFLLGDLAFLHLGWWDGYVRHQLLASATGARTDGASFAWWFTPRVVLGRFWPGLPFVLLALFHTFRSAKRSFASAQAAGAPATAAAADSIGATKEAGEAATAGAADAAAANEAARALAFSCALLLFALCLPARKWGNHTYVLFPLLALLAGAGLGPLLDALALRRGPGLLRGALIALSLLAGVASVAGLGARILQPPCPLAAGLAGPLRALPPGDVLIAPADFALLIEVADETRRTPWPVDALDAPLPAGARPIAAGFVRTGAALPPGWVQVAHTGGWTLAAPEPP